jgi:hypothetical protein
LNSFSNINSKKKKEEAAKDNAQEARDNLDRCKG